MKKIAIIPTLLTLGNAICGFAAIVYASKIDQTPQTDVYFAYSAWLIFAAMVFDGVDGYAARLSKTASDFGGQLDSLCDAISFGAAPAFLVMRMGPELRTPLARQMLAVIATLYMVCAVLRLARFNLTNTPDPASHKRFKGLPSPAAAGCLASLALFRSDVAREYWSGLDPALIHRVLTVFIPFGTLTAALLMVSRLPYPHVTKQFLRGRRHFSHLVRVVLVVFALVALREVALIVIFWGYAASIPVRYLLTRGLRPQPLPPAPGVNDAVPR